MKRTKNGSFSAELTRHDRQTITETALDFLEDNDKQFTSNKLLTESDVMKHLYFTIIYDLFRKKMYSDFTTDTIKWKLTRAEAIALMWLLRTHDNNMSLLEVKSGLHKQLQTI